jgi:carboxyl-terminal processing protease
MTSGSRFSLLLTLWLAAGGLPALGQEAPETADNTGETQPEAAAEELPLDEIRTFTEVFAKVKNDYVEGVNDRMLLENAIRGMLEGLDPHSAYLDREAFLELQEGTSGEFGGLGIEVGIEDGFVKVIAPIDDTPAHRAGIKAGDLIIRLDDTPVKGMSLNDAVNLMRGEPGSSIHLTIIRSDQEKPINITVIRDIIKVKSVRSNVLEPGFGYLRVTHFQTHTPEDVRVALEKLISDPNNPLKGLVLDLRNNPGGILNAAVEISDYFLEEGLIVYTEGRVNDAKLRFNAKPEDLINKAPIVVLVNEGSASAAEIVAGALQDHKRAIIMGQPTFGKGSVQTILPMPDESALKLTTARYYTPSGRSIQAAGIRPDILIDKLKVENLAENRDIIKESNLSGHLENDAAGDADTDATSPPVKNRADTASLSATDYELYEALNVLKGLAILKTNAG